MFLDYSWDQLRGRIQGIVSVCGASANTWEEALLRLRRYFWWEYDDPSEFW